MVNAIHVPLRGKDILIQGTDLRDMKFFHVSIAPNLHIIEASWTNSGIHHNRWDSPERKIGPTQRPYLTIYNTHNW